VIIAREFAVTATRMAATQQGIVIAANWWGKAKTIVQVVGVVFVLLRGHAFALIGLETVLVVCGDVLMIAAAALSVISCVGYFVKNRAVLRELM